MAVLRESSGCCKNREDIMVSPPRRCSISVKPEQDAAFFGERKRLPTMPKLFGPLGTRTIKRVKLPNHDSRLFKFNRLFNPLPEPIRALISPLPKESNTPMPQVQGVGPNREANIRILLPGSYNDLLTTRSRVA